MTPPAPIPSEKLLRLRLAVEIYKRFKDYPLPYRSNERLLQKLQRFINIKSTSVLYPQNIHPLVRLAFYLLREVELPLADKLAFEQFLRHFLFEENIFEQIRDTIFQKKAVCVFMVEKNNSHVSTTNISITRKVGLTNISGFWEEDTKSEKYPQKNKKLKKNIASWFDEIKKQLGNEDAIFFLLPEEELIQLSQKLTQFAEENDASYASEYVLFVGVGKKPSVNTKKWLNNWKNSLVINNRGVQKLLCQTPNKISQTSGGDIMIWPTIADKELCRSLECSTNNCVLDKTIYQQLRIMNPYQYDFPEAVLEQRKILRTIIENNIKDPNDYSLILLWDNPKLHPAIVGYV